MKRKKVARALAAIQEKWAELSTQQGRSGVLEEKKKMVALSMVLPQAEWEDTIVVMTEFERHTQTEEGPDLALGGRDGGQVRQEVV